MSNKAKITTQMPNGKPALTPKLRFPEFRDAEGWEETPLGELGEIVTGKTPSTKEDDLWGGEILFITPTDITEDEKYQHGTQRTVVKTAATKVLPQGSVVYTCIASIGKMALTVRPSITNQQINAVVPNGKTAREFIFYSLANLTPWIKSIPATSTLPIINKTEFSKFIIPHPEDLQEQQKIADCLSSVDELIAAQARKLNTLKTHKKELMQQLFPREGETQPRLRFPEFQNAGKWEPDTLENLCTAKISYGIVQAGPHIPNGMPYIKSTDLNSELCLANLSRTSDVIAGKYRRSEVVPGDLVFSLRGNIGVSQTVPKEIPVANLTQGTARIRTKGSSAFYLHALRSDPVHGRIIAVSKGSTFQEISLEDLRKITLFRPEIGEQQRIADCLTTLDDLIAAQTHKLDALKTHKKGLMQQLFPSPEEVEA